MAFSLSQGARGFQKGGCEPEGLPAHSLEARQLPCTCSALHLPPSFTPSRDPEPEGRTSAVAPHSPPRNPGSVKPRPRGPFQLPLPPGATATGTTPGHQLILTAVAAQLSFLGKKSKMGSGWPCPSPGSSEIRNLRALGSKQTVQTLISISGASPWAGGGAPGRYGLTQGPRLPGR